jgi:fimbrial chaperone protein
MNTRNHLALLAFTVLFTVANIQIGWASSFSVEPVRVKLDALHRTERLTVKNESDQPLTLLIKAYQWTQPNEGIDKYLETEDLVIFPRALTLAAGEERLIRVGVASIAEPVERAFRIYLQEQPITDEIVPKGASARVLMRLGIPVFAQPLTPTPLLKIKDLIIAKGTLRHTVVNEGNSFVMADQITIKGSDDKDSGLFVKELGGFYLLAGSGRTFEVVIPTDQCSRITRISATTRNEGKEQLKVLEMASGACESK